MEGNIVEHGHQSDANFALNGEQNTTCWLVVASEKPECVTSGCHITV
jgi:hypothetical protein